MFTLDPTLPATEQIVNQAQAAIDSGRLGEGARLPSVCQLAARLEVSVFTVVNAYDRLLARGVIRSRVGAGYFVCRRPGIGAPALVAAADPQLLPNTALGLVQGVLGGSRYKVPAGSGFLPEAWLEDTLAPAVLTRALRRQPFASQPAPMQGHPAAREQIALRLAQLQLPIPHEQLLITHGATQAFDLVLRACLRPGDSVLVEDPGYFMIHAQLRALGMQVLPVPRRADGPDLDTLEALAREHRPRLLFTQTLLHNPTGGNTSPQVAHRLLMLAERHDFLVLEDDVYGELASQPGMRLAQIDGLNRVFYIGSFSKTLNPGLRLGYVAAPKTWLDKLIELKVMSTLSGSALNEAVITDILESGYYRRHTERLRERLARARRVSIAALTECGVTLPHADGEGVFLWAQLPDGLHADAITRRAADAGILFAPGTLFSPSGGGQQHLRLHAAYASDPAVLACLREGLDALGERRLRLA